MFKQMDVESGTSKRKRCCKQASIKLLKTVKTKTKQEAVESLDHPRPGTERDR